MPSNVLHLCLKQTFTEGEVDGIESRLPFKIFSSLGKKSDENTKFNTNLKVQVVCMYYEILLSIRL
jgi:hypothetical protein